MSDLTLYGISNCDTVKKARRWLEQRRVSYRFHDFRKDGLTPTQVKTWLQSIDRDTLINKRGRTWRELSEAQKQISSDSQAVKLCCEFPTLIKRPVLVSGKQVIVGFDPSTYTRQFAS